MKQKVEWNVCDCYEGNINLGDEGTSLYIVMTGSLEAFDGSGKSLKKYGPGEYVGEKALLNKEKRQATVKALEDTTVLVIDKESFELVREAVSNKGKVKD